MCPNFSYFLPCFPLPKNWLTESAKLIAQSGRTVEWVTPLGLPIVQPYYRIKPTVVSAWWWDEGIHPPRREEQGKAQQTSRQSAQGQPVCIACR